MISSSVAAAEDIRIVAKVQDMLDLMRQDNIELLLRFGAVPDTITGKVDVRISAKVRSLAISQSTGPSGSVLSTLAISPIWKPEPGKTLDDYYDVEFMPPVGGHIHPFKKSPLRRRRSGSAL
ncbi:hypothetical protein N181_23320 [Sinorhizobium fredii USDA 205]|nr:hypothetical protein N181_23320 [Sinorhizobium fredii USDA 205]